MPGEEQAGGAAHLRGKTEASCDDRRLHLDLAENGNEGSRLQPFLQRPGRVRGVPRLNDEDKRGVETEGDEPRAVRRAPFARGLFGQAPEERRGILPPRQAVADEGKRKGKRRRRVAIGGRLDLMQAVGGKPAPGDSLPVTASGALPSPGKGEGLAFAGTPKEGNGKKEQEQEASRRGGAKVPYPARGERPETREPVRAREYAHAAAR